MERATNLEMAVESAAMSAAAIGGTESSARTDGSSLDPCAESIPAADAARWRRNTIRYHAAMGLLCLAVVGLSVVMSTTQRTRVHLPGIDAPLPELCFSKAMLDGACPGCGMTRAFIALGHGNPFDAWRYNPAALLFFPMVAGQIPWRIIQIVRVRRGSSELVAPAWFSAYAIVVLILMLGQWIIGLVT